MADASSSDPTQTPSPQPNTLVALGLGIGAALLYAGSLGHGFIAYDDAPFILQNPTVTHPALNLDQLLTPQMGYPIPVSIGAQALLYQLGQGQSWPFHLANMLLHGLCTALVFGLGRTVSGHWKLAAAAAALFALHPLHIEPVCWATGIKDLLAAALALGASGLFWRFTPPPNDTHKGQPLALFGAIALGLLAMFAKPNTVALGVGWLVLAAALYINRPKDTPAPKTLKLALFGAIATVTLGLLIGAFSGQSNRDLNFAQYDGTFSLTKLLWVMGRYVANFVWPQTLTPVYPLDDTLWPVALGAVAIILLLGAAVASRKRPDVLFWLALAGAVYLPVSNLIPFPRMMADSYLYLPLALLTVALTAALAPMLSDPSRNMRLALAGLAAAVGLAWLPMNLAGQSRWAEPTLLWEPLVVHQPWWRNGWTLLADQLFFEGRHKESAGIHTQGFRRAYDKDGLHQFGVSLALSGQLQHAQCVLTEAVYHGNARATSLESFVALIVTNPQTPLTHPRHARVLLRTFVNQKLRTQQPLPQAWQQGLGLRYQQTEALKDPDTPWAPQSCPQLQTTKAP